MATLTGRRHENYLIEFEVYDPKLQFWSDSMTFEADDELHAINQLLDFYRTLQEKVACIESVEVCRFG